MSGMGKPSLSMTGKFPLAIQRKVLMVVCESCGGNCDHGELVQGVCPECLEEERKGKKMLHFWKSWNAAAFGRWSWRYGMDTIAISVEKFEKLIRDSQKLEVLLKSLDGMEQEIEKNIRARIFEDYVKNEEYPIDREMCGKFLGFEVG